MNKNYLPIGCYCDGACRSETNVLNYCQELLIEATNPQIAWYQAGIVEKILPLIQEIRDALNLAPDNIDDDGFVYDADNHYAELIDNACDVLADCCAPYTSLGWNDGDFGCWVFLDGHNLKYDFDGLVVSDTGEVPTEYTGEVIHVSDHGNMTLYVSQDGQLTEIWGIV